MHKEEQCHPSFTIAPSFLSSEFDQTVMRACLHIKPTVCNMAEQHTLSKLFKARFLAPQHLQQFSINTQPFSMHHHQWTN